MKFACIALLGLVLIGCAAANEQLRAQCVAGEIEGYFTHDTHCNKFYTCGAGYFYESTCYGTQAWNPQAVSCDYRENVNCGNLYLPEIAQATAARSQDHPGFFL